MIFSRLVQNFGDAYQIPAVFSNVIPPILLAGIAIIILRRSV